MKTTTPYRYERRVYAAAACKGRLRRIKLKWLVESWARIHSHLTGVEASFKMGLKLSMNSASGMRALVVGTNGL